MACARCKQTFYCSRKCQKAHWKTHKPKCGAPPHQNRMRAELAPDLFADKLKAVDSTAKMPASFALYLSSFSILTLTLPLILGWFRAHPCVTMGDNHTEVAAGYKEVEDAPVDDERLWRTTSPSGDREADLLDG